MYTLDKNHIVVVAQETFAAHQKVRGFSSSPSSQSSNFPQTFPRTPLFDKHRDAVAVGRYRRGCCGRREAEG